MPIARGQSRPVVTPELVDELEQVVDHLAGGSRDLEAMQRAAQEMDLAREEIRNRSGDLSVAVDLVRKSRDEP